MPLHSCVIQSKKWASQHILHETSLPSSEPQRTRLGVTFRSSHNSWYHFSHSLPSDSCLLASDITSIATECQHRLPVWHLVMTAPVCGTKSGQTQGWWKMFCVNSVSRLINEKPRFIILFWAQQIPLVNGFGRLKTAMEFLSHYIPQVTPYHENIMRNIIVFDLALPSSHKTSHLGISVTHYIMGLSFYVVGSHSVHITLSVPCKHRM